MKNILRISTLIGALGLVAVFGQNFVASSSSFGGYDIIVVAGQSNAVSASSVVRKPDELANHAVNNKIFQLGRCGGNNLRIIPAKDGLDHVSCNPSTVGFGIPFARRYALSYLKPGRRVLIIPVAEGGTSILQWAPLASERPNVKGFKDSVLFSDMMLRIRHALSDSRNRFVAFHWQQGETDMAFAYEPEKYDSRKTSMMRNASDYKTRLKRLISAVRSQSGVQNVPVLIGEPSKEARYRVATTESFVTVMKEVANETNCSRFVATDGLYSHSNPRMVSFPVPISDGVHFTGDGQIEIGRRRFDQFKQIASCVPGY